MNIKNYINEIAEGALILDGLDDAIIGVIEEFGRDNRILYSKNKIIEILSEREMVWIGRTPKNFMVTIF